MANSANLPRLQMYRQQVKHVQTLVKHVQTVCVFLKETIILTRTLSEKDCPPPWMLSYSPEGLNIEETETTGLCAFAKLGASTFSCLQKLVFLFFRPLSLSYVYTMGFLDL